MTLIVSIAAVALVTAVIFVTLVAFVRLVMLVTFKSARAAISATSWAKTSPTEKATIIDRINIPVHFIFIPQSKRIRRKI